MTVLVEVLLPVILLIAVGLACARLGVTDERAVKALSDITFLVFMPALLFLAMARSDFSQLQPDAQAAYFSVAVPLLALGILAWRWRGLTLRAATLRALMGVFSNTAMLGIPVVKLAFGERGLAILLTIIAVHALVLLTLATLVLEFDAARGAGGRPGAARSPWAVAGQTVRGALLHPVVVPILAGIGWSLSGLALPHAVESAISVLSAAAAPLSLVLLGASLAQFGLRGHLGPALVPSIVKSVVSPLAVYAMGHAVLGLDPLVTAVAAVAAAMPTGANVYLFAQRYQTELATASVAISVSTLLTGVVLALGLPWLAATLR